VRHRGRRVAATLGLSVALALVACGGGISPPPPPSQQSFYFAEELGVAITVDTGGDTPAADTSIASPVIANRTDGGLTITKIDGYDADAGVSILYVGTCSRSCIGAAKASDPDVIQALRSGIEHTLPVTIPSGMGVHGPGYRVTFRVTVTAAGIQVIRGGTGCLWVRDMRVTLSDGRHAKIGGYGGRAFMSLFLDAPGLPPGARRCPLP